MRNLISALVAMLLLFGAIAPQAVIAAQATSDGIARWKAYNVDPSYTTREEAMKDAGNVMKRYGWSDKCRDQMLEKLEHPGKQVKVRKGERYGGMRSGAKALWRNVLVDWQKPPYAVNAERWTIVCDGRIRELTLPVGCNNWLLRDWAAERKLVCVIVNFEVKVEDTAAWERIRRPTDPCFGWRKVNQLYQVSSEGPKWNPMTRGCVRPCDFAEYNRQYGYTQASAGTIPLNGPGFYQVQLSPGEIFVLCVKHARGSSFPAGARYEHDYDLIKGQEQARVFYNSSEMEEAGFALNAPKGLLFYASDEAAERRIHGIRVGAAGLR
jgi:hypothetical protein